MAKIYMINVNEFGEWNKYEYLKQFVSKECRKRADKFYFVEDAKRTVGAELLVRYYLRLNYNTSNRKIEMEYNQYGKPYIKNSNDLYFNISHSCDWIICAWSNHEIGVDLENINIENIMDTLEREKIKLVICDYNKNNDIRFIHIDNLTLNYEKTSAEFWAYETKVFSIFSSGSSGKPKLISHSFDDVLTCIKSSDENIMHVQESDVFYSQSSLAFAYGIVSSIFIPFAFGASTIVNTNGDVFEIVRTVQEKKPTLFFAVPIIYKNLIRMAKISDLDFSSVRVFLSAGELMPPKIITEWEFIFKKTILQGIGSTELLYLYISNTLCENKAGSLGKVLKGYNVEIRDENGKKILGPDKIGELSVSGNSLSTDIIDSNEVFIENEHVWLKTGDLVKIDSENFYWYMGRVSDSFKINGSWVDSNKIANILNKHPKVKEAVISGKLSKDEPTKIVAYIEEEKYISECDIKELKAMVSKSLGREFIPYMFYIVNELPRNANGKIDRKKLLVEINDTRAY